MKILYLSLALLNVCRQVDVRNVPLCEGRSRTCCSGYLWDDHTGMCVECPRGYFGPGCNRVCPYPRFGKLCQNKCTCEQHSCNHIEGCTEEKLTDEVQTKTTVVNRKEIFTVAMENEPKGKLPQISSQKNHYIQRQVIADTDDGTAPIQYTIVCLVGLFGVLLVLYIASYTVKRCRRQETVMETNNIQMKTYGAKEGLEMG